MAEFTNGKFKKPVSLGTEINSEAHEDNPYIAPDGSYLIFVRGGLWLSFKQKDNRWMRAIWMGDDFKNAACPYVSPDGKYFFFLEIGHRYNDVWWMDVRVIEELRPDF
jgi:Tol biopolymer transport system component